MLEALKIIGFSVLAAVTYGILHDQVTAHLCVEYFSLAHPPVFPTESPFLLAIGWGIIATWWVGLALGLLLAGASRLGSAPRFGLAEVRPSVVKLMLASALLALVSGIVGATLVWAGVASVPGGWDEVLPMEKWVAFSADAWAHLASYTAGALGGLFVVVTTFRRRLALRPG